VRIHGGKREGALCPNFPHGSHVVVEDLKKKEKKIGGKGSDVRLGHWGHRGIRGNYRDLVGGFWR